MSSSVTQPKATLGAQFKSLDRIFWIGNWIELVERFAYYGVRVVLPVFMVASFAEGGPQFDHLQKGSIYAVWALVQSFVPILSGGFADRYGYKLNIALSTILKIVGYMLMGYCVYLAEMMAGMPLSEARPQGLDRTYEVFFAGAMFLAAGTAIFKPGVQGLIARSLNDDNGSLGWGVFYQMVNIGGFIGPLLAGYLRILDWEYVFLACAAGIALNFFPLFMFAEPEHEGETDTRGPGALLMDAFRGLLEPRLFLFTMAFAGFWLMFYQLFDILPNFIDDWIDSRGPAQAIAGLIGAAAVPLTQDGNLTQEWMINANALLISFFAFGMGYITGRVHSLVAIVGGIGVSAAAIYGLGMSMSGWWTIGAIALFSIGEMAASPTKMRYLSSIAPPGKKGLYMGYVNMTVGIGWSVGSILAGHLYQHGGDKKVLAKRYLVEQANMSQASVDALSADEVLPTIERVLGADAFGVREVLWNAYSPQSMWLIFTVIGLGSLGLLMAYTYLLKQADADPSHSLNTRGHMWVRGALVPIVVAFLFALKWSYDTTGDLSLPLSVMTLLFAGLFLLSFERPKGTAGA